MLPQQILAVVVSIGRAHDAMDVLLGGLLGVGHKLREVRWALMVEFNQNHGTLDAVIKGAVVLSAADPCKPCVVDVAVNFIHLHAGVPVIHIADVEVDEVAQAASCGTTEIVYAQTGVVENDIVFEGLGEIIVAGFGEVEYGLLALSVGESAQHFQTVILLLLKDCHALVFAGGGAHGFGTDEERRHDDLIAENEIIDDGVMSAKLPAPGVGGRGLAQDGDVVEPLAEESVVAGKLGQRFIQAHDVARKVEAFRAERGAHQAKGGVALRSCHFVEADSLAQVKVLVHPFAPLRVVDREHGSGELHAAKCRDEFFGGIADGLGGDSVRTDFKKAGSDLAVGCDSAEGSGEAVAFPVL